MQLTNDFQVPLPVEQAWEVLIDLERVGPCLPGASITGRDGDDYLGQAKIKLGAITTNYKGTARFVELDAKNRRAVLTAKGREARGGGDAAATVTATLTEQGDVTAVNVVTELALSGKIAQFGRGVIADVSTALLNTFVERLEQMLQAQAEPQAAEEEPKAAESSATPTIGRPRPVRAADEALDLGQLARTAAAARIPVQARFGGLFVVGALIGFLLGRRQR